MKIKNRNLSNYLIIIGCMFLQAVPFGLSQNIQPLFINYLHKNYHFTLQNIGLILTFGSIAASFIAPFAGKLYNRYSTRLVMFIAFMVSVIGMFVNVFANNLILFRFANIVIQIGNVTYSSLGIPYLIGHVFTGKNRSKALGLAFAGGSLGNMFFQPIFTHLLAKYANTKEGLHLVYLIAACLSLFFGLLIFFFLLRKPNPMTQIVESEDNQSLLGIGSKATFSQPTFWLLGIGMLFIGLNVSAQSTQYANFMNVEHLSTSVIGLTGSLFGLAALVGNISGGFIFAKFGLYKATIFAGLLQFLACITMILIGLTNLSIFAYLWAILFGCSAYLAMSGPATIIQNLYGMKETSVILGTFSLFFASGVALANFFFGYFADNLGYLKAWYIVLVFLMLGYLVLSTMIKIIGKEHYARFNSEMRN